MKRVSKLSLALLGTVLAFSASLVNARPIEAVYALEVSDPGKLMGAMDTLFKSDSMKGNQVTLWAAEFSGSRPATHVVTASFDSYESMDAASARRLGSDDWKNYMKDVAGVAERRASLLLTQVGAWGEGGAQHAAGAAFNMTVSDSARYAAAFDKMVKSYGSKGMMRLMAVRAGGEGVTHILLVTAPTMAELNTYLDGLFASDAYRTFAGEVGDIRKIQTTNLYRRVKSWSP